MVRKKTSVLREDVKLSKNFYLSEFTKSKTADALGISNDPPESVVEVIRWVAENVAQPLRDKVGKPVHITSGYRSPKLNSAPAVGGVKDSYHLYEDGAFAFDFVIPSLSLIETMDLLKELSLPITKAILEIDQGVVHVQGKRPEYLARDLVAGKKVYVTFNTYKEKGSVV